MPQKRKQKIASSMDLAGLSGLRIEFYTASDTVNGRFITWRLRLRDNGPILLRSLEKWKTLRKAKRAVGLLIFALYADTFEVFDLTGSAAKTPAGPRKTRALSSTAGA